MLEANLLLVLIIVYLFNKLPVSQKTKDIFNIVMITLMVLVGLGVTVVAHTHLFR